MTSEPPQGEPPVQGHSVKRMGGMGGLHAHRKLEQPTILHRLLAMLPLNQASLRQEA